MTKLLPIFWRNIDLRLITYVQKVVTTVHLIHMFLLDTLEVEGILHDFLKTIAGEVQTEEGVKMAEVRDVLLQIKDKEDSAMRKVEEAKENAEQMLTAAKEKAENEYQETINMTERKVEEMKKNAFDDGEKEAAVLIQEGKEQAESIRDMDPEKLDEAVDWIMERIVGNDGNS